jgi:hypothetical protein
MREAEGPKSGTHRWGRIAKLLDQDFLFIGQLCHTCQNPELEIIELKDSVQSKNTRICRQQKEKTKLDIITMKNF